METSYGGLVRAAAQRHMLDPSLLMGLIMQESGGDPQARSVDGAYGLTQIMPGTAKCYGYDLSTPRGQIDGGADYLARCFRHRVVKGKLEWALAAYNAGWGNVAKYGGIPPFGETRRYIPRVLNYAEEYRRFIARSTPMVKPEPRSGPAFELVEEQAKPHRRLFWRLLYWYKTKGG